MTIGAHPLWVWAFFVLHTLFYVLDVVLRRVIVTLCHPLLRWWPSSASDDVRLSRIHGAVHFIAGGGCDRYTDFGWPLEKGTSEATLKLRGLPAFSCHVSTILANFKYVPFVSYEREIIQGFDGCDLAVDWAYPRANLHLVPQTAWAQGALALTRAAAFTFGAPPPREQAADPPSRVMAIIPGLTSHSQTTYIRSFVRAALSHGFAVMVVHTRGFGTPLTRARMWHGGMTDDIRHWVYSMLSPQAIEQRFGRRLPVCLVGFSLGANMMVNFLAEDGEDVRLRSCVTCAAAVSAPWYFHGVTPMMSRRIQKMTYDRDFRDSLKAYLRDNAAALRDPLTGEGVSFDWTKGTHVPDVPAFDDHVVIPHHGFRSKNEYYTNASCFRRIHQVRLPTCCIHATDDPVCGPGPKLEEWRAACRSGSVCYAEIPYGGHLGSLGHPMAELAGLPTLVEDLTCRSVSHFIDSHTRMM